MQFSFSRLLLYFRSSNVSFTTVCALPRKKEELPYSFRFFSSSDINIDFSADVFSVTLLKSEKHMGVKICFFLIDEVMEARTQV